MLQELKQSLWSQFGASIDSLTAAVEICPESFYQDNKRFFYVAYHTMVFLDYYSTIPLKDFKPPLSFTLTDVDKLPPEAIDDIVPDEFYTKRELLGAIETIRQKCFDLVSSLTVSNILNDRFIEDMDDDAMNYSILEITLYNMRHVQHHAAQLNLVLRQHNLEAPKWIARSR